MSDSEREQADALHPVTVSTRADVADSCSPPPYSSILSETASSSHWRSAGVQNHTQRTTSAVHNVEYIGLGQYYQQDPSTAVPMFFCATSGNVVVGGPPPSSFSNRFAPPAYEDVVTEQPRATTVSLTPQQLVGTSFKRTASNQLYLALCLLCTSILCLNPFVCMCSLVALGFATKAARRARDTRGHPENLTSAMLFHQKAKQYNTCAGITCLAIGPLLGCVALQLYALTVIAIIDAAS